MFNELVESIAAKKRTKKGWAIVGSVMFESAGVLILILVPLIYTQALPGKFLKAMLVAPVPATPAPAPERVTPPRANAGVRIIGNGVMHEPTFIPPTVAVFTEAELPPEIPADANAGGRWGLDLLNSVLESRTDAPPPPVAIPPRRIRQAEIQPAMILAQPRPVYPVLARQAGIQGKVVLHAIIDREGRVSELQVVSGHPLLVEAALAAVQNWRYRPMLLNGEPVEVETTITVSFVLGG